MAGYCKKCFIWYGADISKYCHICGTKLGPLIHEEEEKEELTWKILYERWLPLKEKPDGFHDFIVGLYDDYYLHKFPIYQDTLSDGTEGEKEYPIVKSVLDRPCRDCIHSDFGKREDGELWPSFYCRNPDYNILGCNKTVTREHYPGFKKKEPEQEGE